MKKLIQGVVVALAASSVLVACGNSKFHKKKPAAPAATPAAAEENNEQANKLAAEKEAADKLAAEKEAAIKAKKEKLVKAKAEKVAKDINEIATAVAVLEATGGNSCDFKTPVGRTNIAAGETLDLGEALTQMKRDLQEPKAYDELIDSVRDMILDKFGKEAAIKAMKQDTKVNFDDYYNEVTAQVQGIKNSQNLTALDVKDITARITGQIQQAQKLENPTSGTNCVSIDKLRSKAVETIENENCRDELDSCYQKEVAKVEAEK